MGTSIDASKCGAQYTPGEIYLTGNGVDVDPEKALTYCQLAAEHGHEIAQFNLGKMYLEGKKVPQDLHQALHCLTMAADRGMWPAFPELGKMYLFGIGTEQDDRKAAAYFERGSRKALEYYQMLADHGVPRDDAKAMEYLTMAAGQGEAAAAYHLGELQRKRQNLPEAVKWFKKAADLYRGEAER